MLDIYRSELTLAQKFKICQAIKNPRKSLSKDVKMPKKHEKDDFYKQTACQAAICLLKFTTATHLFS